MCIICIMCITCIILYYVYVLFFRLIMLHISNINICFHRPLISILSLTLTLDLCIAISNVFVIKKEAKNKRTLCRSHEQASLSKMTGLAWVFCKTKDQGAKFRYAANIRLTKDSQDYKKWEIMCHRAMLSRLGAALAKIPKWHLIFGEVKS